MIPLSSSLLLLITPLLQFTGGNPPFPNGGKRCRKGRQIREGEIQGRLSQLQKRDEIGRAEKGKKGRN